MLHSLGHHRAYGVALLVVGLFVSPAYSAFDQTDKQNLYNIYEHVNSLDIISMEFWDWIDDRENAIDTSLSDIHSMRNWLFGQYTYHGDPLAYIVDDSREALEDIRFILAPFTNLLVSSRNSFDPSRSSQVAVTNIAETYWLEKIYNELHGGLNYWSGLSGYTSYQFGSYLYPSDMYAEWEDYLLGNLTLQTFVDHWGAWNFYPIMFSQMIDFDNLSSIEQDRYKNYLMYQCYLDGDIVETIADYIHYDNLGPIFNRQYGNSPILEFFQTSGIDIDSFNSTNFFTADGSIENTDNAFTNSETSVFSKFATSFLPSGMFNPEEVNTNLFEYVDSDISETPSFNPANLSGNGGLRSAGDSFDYDFDDSSGDYDYDLINPLKTATDTVQHDTDLDNKFERMAGLVNQRITDIFQNPLNSISSQSARWQASLIDKDMNETEEYVDPQYSKSSDGVQFVCWCVESMMFFGFFSFCVRRSLRVQQSRDVASAI